MFLQLKDYNYTGWDSIFPLDSEGNKLNVLFGVGMIVKTLSGKLKIIDLERPTDKSKLTSRFITGKGFAFTSLKLKNKLLNY